MERDSEKIYIDYEFHTDRLTAEQEIAFIKYIDKILDLDARNYLGPHATRVANQEVHVVKVYGYVNPYSDVKIYNAALEYGVFIC